MILLEDRRLKLLKKGCCEGKKYKLQLNCTIRIEALFAVLLYHLPNLLKDENQVDGAGMTRMVRQEKKGNKYDLNF